MPSRDRRPSRELARPDASPAGRATLDGHPNFHVGVGVAEGVIPNEGRTDGGQVLRLKRLPERAQAVALRFHELGDRDGTSDAEDRNRISVFDEDDRFGIAE
jgi:hypothetical protein